MSPGLVPHSAFSIQHSALSIQHFPPSPGRRRSNAEPGSTNGNCRNALFDRAFDRGMLTIDEDFRVVISAKLRRNAESADLPCSIAEAHGRRNSIAGANAARCGGV